MTENRLPDYLAHIRQAATDACSHVSGMSKEAWLADRRTQQAVLMNLMIIGEAAAKVMDAYPDWAEQHHTTPWRSMRGMRNRIAHGYFEVNLDLVWETVHQALPQMLATLPHPG